MSTYETRLKWFKRMLDAQDDEPQPLREIVKITYHAVMYEIYNDRMAKARAKRYKHGLFLQNEMRVVQLKDELSNL